MAGIKLNKQWAGKAGDSQFKGYRKFIAGRMFTLGVDEAVAQRKAQALMLAAASLDGQGWTEEVIEQALSLATGVPLRTEVPRPASGGSTKSAVGMSIDTAVENLKEVLLNDYTDRKFDGEHYRGSIRRLNSMKLGLADKHFSQFVDQTAVDEAVRKDEKGEVQRLYMKASRAAQQAAVEYLQAKKLNDLTEDDLRAAKRYWTNRPISVKKLKPISVVHVSNIVHMMTRFFEFAERRLRWQAPPYWKDDMKFGRNQKRNMMSLAERSDLRAAKDHMTHEDVERYFKLGITRSKAIQGLAYWCAWTQIEIATFRKVEMFADKDGETYIDKARSKTGEWGKWWIPEPVAKLVRAEMAKTIDDPMKNPEGLAFLTENNLPLVHGGNRDQPDMQKTDWIAGYMWASTKRACQQDYGRSHSFKWFRKSSAQRIQDITGNVFVAKAFMAQRVPDVSEKYVNAMVEESIVAAKKHWEAMKDIYEEKPEVVRAEADTSVKGRKVIPTEMIRKKVNEVLKRRGMRLEGNKAVPI